MVRRLLLLLVQVWVKTWNQRSVTRYLQGVKETNEAPTLYKNSIYFHLP
jgi:hypothetical protein